MPCPGCWVLMFLGLSPRLGAVELLTGGLGHQAEGTLVDIDQMNVILLLKSVTDMVFSHLEKKKKEIKLTTEFKFYFLKIS